MKNSLGQIKQIIDDNKRQIPKNVLTQIEQIIEKSESETLSRKDKLQFLTEIMKMVLSLIKFTDT